VNVSGLGAKAITKNGTTALVAGDVPSGALVAIIYDGTQFQLQTSANLNPLSSITGLGTGVATALAVNVGSAGAPVVLNGALGTPTSGTGTNCSAFMPVNYLSGLTLSNNGSDAVNDIDIATGGARDSTDAYSMVLASALTKRLDASWAVGTNQGGLDTGVIANAVYHVFLIARPDTGVVDALFSTSATAPTMPTNYTLRRRIGAIQRVAGSILAFTQTGDEFRLTNAVADVSANNPGTAAVTRNLSVPAGVKVVAIIGATVTTGGASVAAYFSDLATTDEDPASSLLYQLGSTTSLSGGFVGAITTNTSGQIRSRLSASSAAITLSIKTIGWIDRRGRD
jgi:hypothetical protein